MELQNLTGKTIVGPEAPTRDEGAPEAHGKARSYPIEVVLGHEQVFSQN